MCYNRLIQPGLGSFGPEPDPHRTHPRIPAGQPDPPRPTPDHGEVPAALTTTCRVHHVNSCGARGRLWT